MVNKYKSIVLLKGLEKMSDYHYRMVKSLLSKELKLSQKMQDDYDRIRIADLMEETFPIDAGLGELIKVCEDIPELGNLSETLKKERTKVQNANKRKTKTAQKRNKKEEPSTSQPNSSINTGLDPQTTKNIPSSKKTINTEGSKKIKLTKEKNELLKHPAIKSQQADGCPKTPHKPLLAPSSSSSIKKTINTEGSKKIKLTKEKNELLKHPAIKSQQADGCPKTPHKPLLAPSSSSSIKKTINTEGSKKIKLTKEKNELLNHPAIKSQQADGCPKTPHKPLLAPSSSSSIKKSGDTSMQTQDTMKTQVSNKFSTTSMHQTVRPAATASSSLQTSQVYAVIPHSACAQVPLAMASSGVQASQVPSATASSSLQTPQVYAVISPSALVHVPLAMASRGVQTPQVPSAPSSISLQTQHVPLRPSSSVQHIPKFSVTAASSVQGPRVPPVISFSSLLNPRVAPDSQVPPASAGGGLPTPSVPPATASRTLRAPNMTPASACSSFQAPKRPRSTNIPKEPSMEDGHKSGPKEVTVLKATEPFTYDVRENKKMFHATVATECEFFRVKVFDIVLKEKFVPNKVIAISDYYGRNGFLEIYHASRVSEMNVNQLMTIPTTLRRNAIATPKIDYLCSQNRQIFVNGVYMVYRKNVRNECTYYGIRDNTGMMEVVVYGPLTNINCEAGDQLKLVCFELSSSEDTCQLRSVLHSHMEVIKARAERTVIQL